MGICGYLAGDYMQQPPSYSKGEIFFPKYFFYASVRVPIHLLIFFTILDFNGYHSKKEYSFV